MEQKITNKTEDRWEGFSDKEIIDFAIVSDEISDTKIERMKSFETEAQQAMYVREAFRIAEEEAFKEKIQLQKKKMNKIFIAIVVYAIAIFPLSYFMVSNIDLSIFNSIGAVALAIIVTIFIVVMILIRFFFTEYYEMKIRLQSKNIPTDIKLLVVLIFVMTWIIL